MLNKMCLIGNLGKDPEMRTVGDTVVTSFSVATTEKRGDKEDTQWFNVSAWGKLGEVCNQYLSRGRQVYVEGRLSLRSWEGDDGQTHYNMEINAQQVVFLGKKESNGVEF